MDYQTSMVKYSKAIAVTAQEMVSQFILLHARYFVMDCHGNKRGEGAVAVLGREFDKSEQRFDSSVEFSELTTQDSKSSSLCGYSSSYHQVHSNCRVFSQM